MTDESLPTRPVATADRDRTVERLCEHFARDHLETEELERRLDLVYAAQDKSELEALESDLPALAEPPRGTQVTRPATATAVRVDPSREPGRGFVVAIMGGAARKGPWTVPREMTLLAVMGGAELDLRDATFTSRTTTINVVTIMGGTDVIVPPGVRVEADGFALMGAFERGEGYDAPPADAPVLRLRGVAMMGAVEVSVRLPGESARDARKRIKAINKARAKIGAERSARAIDDRAR